MNRVLHSAIVVFATAATVVAATNTHHKVSVTIYPEQHRLEVIDRMSMTKDQATKGFTFSLNSNLAVTSGTRGVSVVRLEGDLHPRDPGIDREEYDSSSGLRQRTYRVSFAKTKKPDTTVLLKYEGTLNYPIVQSAQEYARGFSQTPGIIDEKGIYLAGSTIWIPVIDDGLISFELTVTVPEAWSVVSQGKRTRNEVKNGLRVVVWDAPDPTEEVYLIAAKFTEYSSSAAGTDELAFLRTPDEALARKYLEATGQYLQLYRKLIGPYPYSKFALVENFWETGYGMPSFTLLGEQIIRFPFILNSSYPHELLHNYWGNSVYVDGKSGNWCEGLTAYLADHLLAEQRGQGDDYRRSTLQKYADFVTPGNDFPLTTFRSRTSASSEAVGYGKALFVWNMLREEIGDGQFVKALQQFFRENKFRFASFADIRAAFESTTGKNLQPFFSQWIERTGAPGLQLSNVLVKNDAAGHHLLFSLKQVQQEDPFVLRIPVAISMDSSVEVKKVTLEQREQSFDIVVPGNPRRIQIDPQWNLFRRLHSDEIPPSLTRILGAQEIVILLPSGANRDQQEYYRDFAVRWSGDSTKKITIIYDSTVTALPAGKSAWVLGSDNLFAGVIKSGLKKCGAELTNDSVRLGQTMFALRNRSVVATVRHPGNPSAAVVLVSTDTKAAIPGLVRKIPHYGKYGYLLFEGADPTNIAKGEWESVGSPLDVTIPGGVAGQAGLPGLPKRKALAESN